MTRYEKFLLHYYDLEINEKFVVFLYIYNEWNKIISRNHSYCIKDLELYNYIIDKKTLYFFQW